VKEEQAAVEVNKSTNADCYQALKKKRNGFHNQGDK
jgi:hypothetical protein